MYRKVRFSNCITYILENADLEIDLKCSRQSDFQQRRVDYFRYLQLLTPILDKHHRQKVFEKYFQS